MQFSMDCAYLEIENGLGFVGVLVCVEICECVSTIEGKNKRTLAYIHYTPPYAHISYILFESQHVTALAAKHVHTYIHTYRQTWIF